MNPKESLSEMKNLADVKAAQIKTWKCISLIVLIWNTKPKSVIKPKSVNSIPFLLGLHRTRPAPTPAIRPTPPAIYGSTSATHPPIYSSGWVVDYVFTLRVEPDPTRPWVLKERERERSFMSFSPRSIPEHHITWSNCLMWCSSIGLKFHNRWNLFIKKVIKLDHSNSL